MLFLKSVTFDISSMALVTLGAVAPANAMPDPDSYRLPRAGL